MKKKTIYWIVAIVILLWFVSCAMSGFPDGNSKACNRKMIPQGEGIEDKYGEYEWNSCSIFRVLGLLCRKQNVTYYEETMG